MRNGWPLGALLGALAIGCAHAPASSAVKAPLVERVFVTGSHIPQRIDLASGALPTISPLHIYSREQIGETGRPYDLGFALSVMELSVSR